MNSHTSAQEVKVQDHTLTPGAPYIAKVQLPGDAPGGKAWGGGGERGLGCKSPFLPFPPAAGCLAPGWDMQAQSPALAGSR